MPNSIISRPPSLGGAQGIEDINRQLNVLDLWLNENFNPEWILSTAVDYNASDLVSGVRLRVDASAANRVITLDKIRPVGWRIEIVKSDNSANSVTVSGTGVTFNVAGTGTVASVSSTTQFETLEFVHIGLGVFDLV